MRRKVTKFLAILTIIFCIALHYYMKTTMYERIVKASPEEINCIDMTVVDSVTMLGEYIVIVSEDGMETRGVASFESNGKIYSFGHPIEEPVGSMAFKVEESSDKAIVSNLMGEVILNEKNGVIINQYQELREYSTIPVAKTIRLGEAFMLGRDDEGNICQYPITVEAFSEKDNVLFYSSFEMQLGHGISGMPIVQNDELIGIHYGTAKNGRGIGWVVWSLDIVVS